jgi:hypothetical protein
LARTRNFLKRHKRRILYGAGAIGIGGAIIGGTIGGIYASEKDKMRREGNTGALGALIKGDNLTTISRYLSDGGGGGGGGGGGYYDDFYPVRRGLSSALKKRKRRRGGGVKGGRIAKKRKTSTRRRKRTTRKKRGSSSIVSFHGIRKGINRHHDHVHRKIKKRRKTKQRFAAF